MQLFDESLEHRDAELLAAIAEALPVPVFLLDADGRYLAILGAADLAEHHDPAPLIGRRMHDVFPAPIADRFIEEIRNTIADGRTRTIEYHIPGSALDEYPDARGPDGDQWYEARVCPARDLGFQTPVVITIASNITERVKARRMLERLANTDALTGLLNRRAFIERAEALLAEHRKESAPLSLVLLDIDHFKQINDTHGHAAGDAVLAGIGRFLAAQLRTSDVLARLGGEEFVALMPGADAEMAMIRVERLRMNLATERFCPGNEDVRITVSGGVAEVAPGMAMNTALHRADMALYSAKDQGKNRVIVDRHAFNG